jgi:hypothetical protein
MKQKIGQMCAEATCRVYRLRSTGSVTLDLGGATPDRGIGLAGLDDGVPAITRESLPAAGHRGLATVPQILGEIVWQIAPANRIDRLLEIIFDADELDR